MHEGLALDLLRFLRAQLVIPRIAVGALQLSLLRDSGDHANWRFDNPANRPSASTAVPRLPLVQSFNLDGGHIEIDGFHVIGLGYSNPTPFDTPGEYSEEELEQRLHAFDGLKPMIAICHVPPYQTMLDRITNFRHAGSKSMRDFLQREAPRYFFCGHIHEAAGVAEKLGETSAMNVGKKGYLLDLNHQKDLGLI